jgi:hypothetical protein
VVGLGLTMPAVGGTMASANLYETVIKPDLKHLLELDADVSLTSLLCFWDISENEAALQAQITDRIGALTQLQVSERSTKIVTDVILGEANLLTIPGMFNAVKTAGTEVFIAQLGAIIGRPSSASGQQKTLQPPLEGHVRRIVRDVFYDLEMAMPLKKVRDCTNARDPACVDPPIVTSIYDFFISANRRVAEKLKDTLDPATMEWMFTELNVTMLMIVGLAPWLFMRYIGMYIPGQWNNAVRPDATFYDARYAELLLYKTMLYILATLTTLNTGDRMEKLSATMSELVTRVVTKMQQESGQEALKDMYTHVASLSKRSKDNTMALAVTNAKLSQRRSIATSLLNNNAGDETIMRRHRRVFYAWLAAYAVLVAACIFLIINDRHSAFMLLAGMVLCVITLYILAAIVRNSVQTHGFLRR